MRFKVELVNAEIAPHRWAKLPESPIVPLTAILPVKMTSGAEGQHYAVIYASSSAGYDRVALCWSRNYENRFAELEAGEWSQWIEDSAKIGDDEDGVAVSYRFKLVALSSDAGDFSLYRTPIFPAVGWTVPDELAATLHRNVGPFLELGGLHFCHWWGWFSEPEMQELFLDEFRYQVDWLSKAADQLLASPGWDLFITQWHGIDHIDHSYLSCFDPASPLHEDGVRMVRETYRLADQLVGSLLKYVDEDTLLVITSDHGHTAVHDQGLDENALLEQNGYLAFEEEPSVKSEHSGDRATSEDRIHGYNPTGRAIDWSRTKAAVIHDGFLFINLKGRYEHGIVPPEEYEELRRALITLLEDVRSKRNPNVRRYQFVWPKEDAELLGLYGDRVGDVVFYNKVSERGGHHGNFNASRDTDYGSLRACTMFMGPGVKRETVLPRAISLTDIVPTVCYLSRLPLPKNAEGRVVQEIIEDMEQG
ncbi:MAG: alkaline phosphatase family protein [Bacillota bacterium]